MRTCFRCQNEMKEGFEVKVEGGGFGIKIFGGKGVFAKRIEKPRVAICPKCGEISLYIENPDGIESK